MRRRGHRVLTKFPILISTLTCITPSFDAAYNGYYNNQEQNSATSHTTVHKRLRHRVYSIIERKKKSILRVSLWCTNNFLTFLQWGIEKKLRALWLGITYVLFNHMEIKSYSKTGAKKMSTSFCRQASIVFDIHYETISCYGMHVK